MLRRLIFLLSLSALTVAALPRTASAGGIIVDLYGDEDNAMPAAPSTDTTPLSPEEQQLYLWTAMIFNGHDAAVEKAGGHASQIIDDLGGDMDGGCAAAPTSLFSLLAAPILLRRRKVRR